MTNFAKINEKNAQALAKENIEVFFNEAGATYITYPEIAEKKLTKAEYEIVEISNSECLTYFLMTYHYISFEECSYPIRELINPQFVKETEPDEEPS